MVAIGKKDGPAVGVIFRGPNVLRDRRCPRPVSVDALERALRVGRIDNYTLLSPTAAASRQSGGEHLRSATRDRHLLQFAVGEKRDVSAVRRPERITCALRAGQQRDA